MAEFTPAEEAMLQRIIAEAAAMQAELDAIIAAEKEE
jgi:hypothetical protein